MTQPTKPSAGALRAAKIIAELVIAGKPKYSPPLLTDTNILAEMLDEETGVAELLEAAKQVLADLSDEEVPDADTVEMLEHAIAKVEQ